MAHQGENMAALTDEQLEKVSAGTGETEGQQVITQVHHVYGATCIYCGKDERLKYYTQYFDGKNPDDPTIRPDKIWYHCEDCNRFYTVNNGGFYVDLPGDPLNS